MRRRPATVATLVLIAAAVAAGVGAAVLIMRGDLEPRPLGWTAALALVVGWSYIGCGVSAWRQLPGNRLGPVMVFIGFAWFATFVADAHDSFAFTAGTAVEDIYLLGFVYLVLSFPTGRLHGRVDRALVAAALVLVTVVDTDGGRRSTSDISPTTSPCSSTARVTPPPSSA